jgi:hypothetical protein
MQNIFSIIKDMQLLFVFDYCHQVLTEDSFSFQDFIQELMENATELQIIIVSQVSISGFSDISE